MTTEQAILITNLIVENGFKSILELGFRHGVSTCYIAAALDELGEGNIKTIDLTIARENTPNIEALTSELGLDKYVDVFYEPTSYTWRLMKMLEQKNPPTFDLCYIDGAHNWYHDGFAFLLADKMLKPGGMIILDDLDWTYNSSPDMKKSEFVKNMPKEERETAQVRKVYELLLKKNPNYSEFQVSGNWALARKKNNHDSLNSDKSEVTTEVVYRDKHIGLGAILLKIWNRVKRNL